MDYNFQIVKLSSDFYNHYNSVNYPEILSKNSRAYNCFIFEIRKDIFVCVPYRTEIHHPYAYKFKNSYRSQKHNSGLDFTKSVIITDKNYISKKQAIIDKDEYNETILNIETISSSVYGFIDDYIQYNRGIKIISKQEFCRRYRYSPLKYFHKELNI